MMKMQRILLAASLCLAAIGFAEPQIRVAQPAPAFALRDADGAEVKLADFAGRALLVCFIATWDKHCLTQISILKELQSRYRTNELAVLAVALDQPAGQPLKTFAREQQLNFALLQADYKTIQDFGGLNAIPTTFVIDKNHNIIEKHVGVVEAHALEPELKAVLRQ